MMAVRHRPSRILDGQRLPLDTRLQPRRLAPRAVLFALAVACLAAGLAVVL